MTLTICYSHVHDYMYKPQIRKNRMNMCRALSISSRKIGIPIDNLLQLFVPTEID
jgi:hypothetical protein